MACSVFRIWDRHSRGKHKLWLAVTRSILCWWWCLDFSHTVFVPRLFVVELVVTWKWVNNFTPHFVEDVITYPCWNWIWSVLEKWIPGRVMLTCKCLFQINSQQYSYQKTSSISRTKSQNLNASRLVLQLSLPNPLKPGVKSRMKMQLEQRRQAMLQLQLSDQQFCCRY